MWMARRWGWLAVLMLLVGCGGRRSADPLTTQSESSCAEALVSWADRCSARERLVIQALQCPETDLALLDLGEEAPLRVELRRATPQSFRRVGDWSLSPVGDFADWSQVHPSLRERFDKVTACVRVDEGFVQGFGTASRVPRRQGSRAAATMVDSIPWLLLAALGCALLSLHGRLRSIGWRHRAALGAAMAAGTFILRELLHPGRFFHQNGQGPLWVSVVLSPPEYHPYGPGYRALFGWLRWCTRDPDRGVFLVQGLLGCLAVPAGAFLARRLGARRPLALALALAVAVDPIVGRLSQSESYYGTGVSLLLLAAALLASSMTALRLRSAGFLLPVLGAALIIAQHALVHPVGWLAAALTPAVLLLGPGHWRRRARRALVASLIIAAVVAVVAGPSMLTVLRSPFGDQWAGRGSGALQNAGMARRLLTGLPSGLLAAALVAVSARGWRRGALHGLVLLLSLCTLLMADLVGFGVCTTWVHQAYLRLYAPIAVALAAVVLQRLPRSRSQGLALAAVVLVLALGVSARSWRAWTKLPTDALEQEQVRRWRVDLPARSQVAYLERVDRRIVVLPIYKDAPRSGPTPIILRAQGFVEDLVRQGNVPFYVHTSLCSTPEGRPVCAQIERRYRMTKLREVVLPAVPSMIGLRYDVSPVRIALYRVDGAR